MKLINMIYLWSKKKIEKDHLKNHKCDIKCNKCKEWYSVSGVEFKHQIKSLDFGYSTVCGKCGEKSYWNSIAAPVPLLCDESGNPIGHK